MEPAFTHPSPTSSIIKNMAQPPKTSAPPPDDDSSEYLCGDTSPLQGVNPGRNQDVSRVDECVPASYSYSSGASGMEMESETDSAEGF